MSDLNENGGNRKGSSQGRSPAYPYISLRKALKRAGEFWNAEGKHTVPLTSAYRAWGLGEKSSGSRQTVAALKQFGLLEYEGGGSDRRVRLSNRALNILLDKQPESRERDKLIRLIAFIPQIYSDLWNQWGAELPSDATIETYLVRDRAYNESAAPDLISDYKDTISFAKLREPDKMSPDGGDENGEEPDQFIPPLLEKQVRVMEGERVVFTDEIEPNHHVRLVVSGAVDKDIIDSLEDYVDRQKKRLGINEQKADNK